MLIATLLMFLGPWRSFTAAKVLRILDGKIVDNNQYPFAVMTRWEIKGKGIIRGCSGSLIAAQWVLSAGHCISSKPVREGVFVGNETTSYRQILKGFPHPNYELDSSRDDIGLIFIEKLESVKLARVSGMDYKSLSGLPVTFAGFGNINNDYNDRFEMRPFQIGEGVVVNCNPKEKLSLSPGICVAPKCNKVTSGRWGDSGGPLMFRDTIIGVASRFKSPEITVFCPVSPYLEWINVIMSTQQ